MAAKRKAANPTPELQAFIIRMSKPGQLRSLVFNTHDGLQGAEDQAQRLAATSWAGWSVFDVKPYPEVPSV